MEQDWVAWHEQYDEPNSALARRLVIVKERVRQALAALERPRLISMCAGDGREVVPVLTDTTAATLVELDPRLAGRARAMAAEQHKDVRVIMADAGLTDAYRDAAPADVIMVCGVFGNVSEDDIRNTIDLLPTLAAPDATVIWTRGKNTAEATSMIREHFAKSGFTEVYAVPPDEPRYVGVHKLNRAPEAFRPDTRMFTFV